MPLVSEMVHPRSLDFQNQRKVVILRDTKQLSWESIAEEVVNLEGAKPSPWLCRQVYNSFNCRKGRRAYRYSNCGRKPWTISKGNEKLLLKRLRALRRTCACTSTTLQRELLREKGVQVECSIIRKVLTRNGYKWLPRAQKPKYSQEDKAARVVFAQEVLAMTPAELRSYLAMTMDGVVLTLPPADPVHRENYCRVGETHMWRTRSEAAKHELSGGERYTMQVPAARAVPMWGGIGPGGFGLVLFHEKRKVDQHEWAKCVADGKLHAACKDARLDRQQGPWHILCDNESFLTAPAARAAHDRARVELWHIPPRSPDLNPVEKFWSWLRRCLRQMDLADLKAKRPPIQKHALKARVRALLRTDRARAVARKTFATLRKSCEEVVAKGGAACRS